MRLRTAARLWLSTLRNPGDRSAVTSYCGDPRTVSHCIRGRGLQLGHAVAESDEFDYAGPSGSGGWCPAGGAGPAMPATAPLRARSK